MSLIFIRVFAGFLSGLLLGIVLTRHYQMKASAPKAPESAPDQS